MSIAKDRISEFFWFLVVIAGLGLLVFGNATLMVDRHIDRHIDEYHTETDQE